MSRAERGMFRIYVCGSCGHVGHDRIEEEIQTTNCVLCGCEISHSSDMQYAATAQEAEEAVLEKVVLSNLQRTQRSSGKGEGTKKRLLRVIQGLSEMNRGRDASWKAIFAECEILGISVERARHFIAVLEQEGMIATTSEGIRMGGAT